MKARKFMKKMMALVLVFAMLAPIMGNLGTNASEVQAEDTTSVGYVIIPSSAVTAETTANGKVMSVNASDATYGQYADYIFAGWYTDAKATQSVASGKTGDYARFVPADVLSTKVQVTNGVVTDTRNTAYNGKYVMRFVSTVDSLDYRNVGFEVSYTDASGNLVKMTSTTGKVFKRIDSTTGGTDSGVVDSYKFSPKVVDTKSEYFITAKWPVTPEDISVNYTVKAFWTTNDGTKVYGAERCVSAEDGTGTTAQERINLTVDCELDKNVTYTATYNTWSGGVVRDIPVEVLTVGDGYSNIRITGADRNTKSVFPIYIEKNNTAVITASYRNLYSKYENEGSEGNITTKADGSWYSESEDEYVIATRADLYGLAALVNGQTTQFAGKTIYIVSDISANPEKLELLEGDNYLKWYTYDDENQKIYQDKPSHNWAPIGKYTASISGPIWFAGNLDGQGHTISGIYMNTSNRFSGLFAALHSSVTIKNLKLKNSRFIAKAADAGSIAGVSKGNLDSVYSNAIVDCTSARSGGLIGQFCGTDGKMEDCWFDGTITSTANSTTNRGIGGLIGIVTDGANITVNSCQNTGAVDVSEFTVQPYAGGLIGQLGQGTSGTLVMENCLSTGEVRHASAVTQGYGSVVGCVMSGGDSSISSTYGTNCNRAITAATGSVLTKNDIKNITVNIQGTAAEEAMPKLSFGTKWTTVAHGIPVLSVFKEEVYDTSWYSADKKVYVLEDMGDLYGFAYLSTKTHFKGKIVKVTNDIIVNKGSAEVWAAGSVPNYTWTPIGDEGASPNADHCFQGTFDGGLHTISGIYHTTDTRYSGLFAAPKGNAVIKNLKLTNSYFKSSTSDFGSIAGGGEGDYNTIYSDAIVAVTGTTVERAGGLVGHYAGTGTMDNCWYAGTFTNTGASGRYHGGLVGLSNGTLTMMNCLNTGTIKTATTTRDPFAGGLIGCVNSGTTAEVANCLNVGLIQQDATKTSNYGAIVGRNNGTMDITKASTYATTESARSHYKANVGTTATALQYTTVAETNMIGSAATTNLSGLDWTVWTAVDYKTPVLSSFKNESDGRIDVSWFDADAYDTTSEYTLYNDEELYGFAMISKTKDFSGKTVKLGADIVVNEGTASVDWATTSNYRHWLPIGSTGSNAKKDFLGTFDGQGHTISGLYINTTWRYTGLFASVGSTGTVQNVQLKESYFKCTNREFGGIAGLGAGKFYNIYNNVIMNGSAATNGGFIGMSGTITMEKCWFEGTLTNTYNDTGHQGTGGLIGYANSGTVIMSNCLNSGIVDMSSQTKNATAKIAGLIGYANIPVTMNACFNAKAVIPSATATKGYGPLVGYCGNKVYVSVSATYVLDTTDIPTGNTLNAMNLLAQTTSYEVVTESDIKTKAATAMPLLNWSDDWKAVSNAMPELKFNYTTSVNGQKFVATAAEQTALANLYTGRTLFQGEMHNHAYTYGRGQDIKNPDGSVTLRSGDDGAYTLAEWEAQMTQHDLDFAASMDHQQHDHIDREDWKISKFVYGTEAMAYITDLKDQESSNLLHFDMIFKTKAQFVSILEKYSSKFGYTGRQRSDGTWFTYDNLHFTKAQFATLIKDVYAAGGVVNLPHPLQGPDESCDYSTELLDYVFDVQSDAGKQIIYGFHVITSGLTTGNSNTNYPAWEQLLNQGYRIYATSGSDNHAALHANTLTSIYAATCKTGCDGTCNNTNCTAYDKGNLLSQVSCGDYVAGSVGIQMSIGDTVMGGSRTFASGDRLVIGIGDIHYGTHSSSSQTFRVDVINEDGVVYSQKVTAGDTIALNVNTDSDFYRVVIYNVNTSARIAIGNPIWNDK